MELSASNQGPLNALPGNPADASSRQRASHRNLSRIAANILMTWLRNHWEHPYPSELDKANLKRRTGMTLTQINNWFINGRRRYLRKIAEENQIPLIESKKYGSIRCGPPVTVAAGPAPMFVNIGPAVPIPLFVAPSPALLPVVDHGLPITGRAEENDVHQPAIHVLNPPANAINESPAPAEQQATTEQDRVTNFQILAMVASMCMLQLDKEEAEKEAAQRSNTTT